MKRTPRIFIGYAREDYETVEKLYRSLEDRGYAPWMDKRDIIGGEDWERSITRAVRQSDFSSILRFHEIGISVALFSVRLKKH